MLVRWVRGREKKEKPLELYRGQKNNKNILTKLTKSRNTKRNSSEKKES